MRARLAAMSVLVGLTACTASAGSPSEPTVPTAVSTTSTPTTVAPSTPDVSVVPGTIDEAYVNAVLAALDEVDGDATRLIYEAKALPPEAADLLNAIYSDEAFQLEVEGWFRSLADDESLGGVRPDPGNRRTVVHRLIAASPGCIWFAVRRDYSARNVGSVPDRLEYLALEPIDRSNDPRGVNPTPWMITVDGFRRDGREPANPCGA